MAVAAGVLLIALHGSAQNLEDILFGDALTLDTATLRIMAGVSLVTLGVLTLIYRPLVEESFDPVFLRSVRKGRVGWGAIAHAVFLILAVLNMVESYRAMGTLMSAGLMLIRRSRRNSDSAPAPDAAAGDGIAMLSSMTGLIIASAAKVPAGPAIILIAGSLYIFSLLFGRFGSIRAHYFPFRHLKL